MLLFSLFDLKKLCFIHFWRQLLRVLCVVYLFYEFDKFWFAEKPADIMQFNVVKDKFVSLVSGQLQMQTAQLRLSLTSS